MVRSLLDLKKPTKEIIILSPSRGVITQVEYIYNKPKDWNDELWAKWIDGLGKIYKNGKFRVSINKKGEVVINRYRWQFSRIQNDCVFFSRGNELVQAYIDKSDWQKVTK